MQPWIEVTEGDMQRQAENAFMFRRSFTKPWGYLCTQPGHNQPLAADTEMECYAEGTDRVSYYCPSMTRAEFESLEQDMVGGEVEPEEPNGGEGVGEAPTNVDVPYIEQLGDTLACTMGNWTGEPTEYHYQWLINGNPVGDGTERYTIQSGDIGATASCVVTATNAHGSTEAPASNELEIGAPVQRR